MKTGQIPIAHPMIGAEERDAVERVLLSGALTQGVEVERFEWEFSEIVAGRPCVAVSSGTSALHLGLLAAGVGPGHEVIVPSFTFAATANAVILAGATPVFADIDASTYCLDPASVEAAITPRTVGIMPVHLFGQSADMRALITVASRYSLALFEDACQAHGATDRAQPVGSFGSFAAFSFYPTKNMTTGEGGMAVCADEAIARRVRLLRNQGMEQRYKNEVVGFNARMTDVAAAMGRVQLRRLPAFTSGRQDNAAVFDRALHGVTTPFVRDGVRHVYNQYTLRVRDRDSVVAALRDRGVGASVYYPTPVHRLAAYASSIQLPVTDRAAAEVVSIPVHPALERYESDRIIAVVNEVAMQWKVAS